MLKLRIGQSVESRPSGCNILQVIRIEMMDFELNSSQVICKAIVYLSIPQLIVIHGIRKDIQVV